MRYTFNNIQNVSNEKVFFENETQACFIKENELHIYNDLMYYVYKNNEWFTFVNDIYFPCGIGAYPTLELNVERQIIQELLYIASEEEA